MTDKNMADINEVFAMSEDFVEKGLNESIVKTT